MFAGSRLLPVLRTVLQYCNNVNYVKNNAIFEPPNMRACSSTPPKQNQDFVKEHNGTPLKYIQIEVILSSKNFKMLLFWCTLDQINVVLLSEQKRLL